MTICNSGEDQRYFSEITIMGFIITLHLKSLHYNLNMLIGFLDPQNMGLDTKITFLG